jgi:hypothetical protein
MDRMKLLLGPLLVFLLGAVSEKAFGQAAAEAGLVTSISAASTAHAASSLGATMNRALEGAGSKVSVPVSAPARTTVAHKAQPAVSKGSAASTKSAAVTGNGAKLPEGVVHVWPPDALNQEPAAPKL